MDNIKDILKNFKPTQDKYISREFQPFGVYLSEKLEDKKRIGLYMKYAKTLPRPVLEEALRFVIDSRARNKAALFMWKLKELGMLGKKTTSSKESPDTKKRTHQPSYSH